MVLIEYHGIYKRPMYFFFFKDLLLLEDKWLLTCCLQINSSMQMHKNTDSCEA